jgi:hypothetical protein
MNDKTSFKQGIKQFAFPPSILMHMVIYELLLLNLTWSSKST